MNKLIINTANDTLVVVLSVENNIFLELSDSKMHHNETMLPIIDKILKTHNLTIQDIDELGVVIGPGSFTGIRVGIATIKAFRDCLNISAKGINNLRLLYNLAKAQNDKITTVAIAGSRDSYFVASVINQVFYIYDHNLTLEELKNVAEGRQIAMYTDDSEIRPFVVTINAKIILETFNESVDEDLLPHYYQLSQAENETLKRANIEIFKATKTDIDAIFEIEKSSINVNSLSYDDIKRALIDDNYITIKAQLNNEIIGFMIVQITDEANVVSIAVKKSFRNIGIASKLFSEAFSLLRKRGISVISLEVKYDNITAYNLYKKLGFVVRRKRAKYYADGSDCLEMCKNIND